ncbi:hypothetical protein BMI91_18960 [Thioclava sediminum]|uniref:Uncharacterized protein n=1 Tax=Thioclava sediminum TaxID=1915319 RepID=A0ABX3MSQ7_9RHOB|nr:MULTISPECIES: hypothetical protein [Thioclava]MAQ38793.1 hypothetical protein [Thioclava sp.]MPQ94776.1 hypothetical protein [Thioclava sp. JE_KL1]OOY05438.1 hypothetical protein BMI87_05125 [Thioclava sp. F28-4]OOY07649.1 hypothetical protein BMI89_16315 [Thioclava sp. F36-7]OOY18637.1 hypothetical protein BMI86_19805 [Thioclava sp. DLFJ5-1]
MDLIVGNKKVTPKATRRIPGGIEAELVGEELTSLIDATFTGIEIACLGGDLDHHALDVTDIRMGGGATTVTLMTAREMALH